ncbi:50S ribosomal protein L24e [uncultured archaeon]|nr:50S ribosomal protein L24e [uncultured archaeon]
MPTCSYCRKSFKEPRGLTVFTFDGRSLHYCSGKCIRNQNLGRDARKLNWVRRRTGFLEASKANIEENSVKVEKTTEKEEKK